MNKELIEVFATHADFHVGNEHYDKTPEEQERLWVEMYTRLVVQECADVAVAHDAVDIYEDIREHFGVEK